MRRLPLNEETDLHAQLLAAHAVQNRANLVRLYGQAADVAEQANQIEAACFYLTYAYVFALEIGDEQAAKLHKRLLGYGREE